MTFSRLSSIITATIAGRATVAAFCSMITISSAFGEFDHPRTVRQTATISMVAVEPGEMMFLGQAAAERKAPSLLDKWKAAWGNLGKGHDDDSGSVSPQSKAGAMTQTTNTQTPVRPPKPVTIVDLQRSNVEDEPSAPITKTRESIINNAHHAHNTDRLSDNTAEYTSRRNDTAGMNSGSRMYDEESEASDNSIWDRLKRMQQKIFLDAAESTSTEVDYSVPPVNPMRSTQRHTGASQYSDPVERTNTPVIDDGPFSVNHNASFGHRMPPGQPPINNRMDTPADHSADDIWGQQIPSGNAHRGGLAGIEVTGQNRTQGGWNQPPVVNQPMRNVTEMTPPGPFGTTTNSQAPAVHRQLTDANKTILASPQVEVETICPPRLIVGQEASFRFKAVNRGGAAADFLVITIDIPKWIDVLVPDISAGTTAISDEKETQSDLRQFVWKIPRVDAQGEEQLVLHVIPRICKELQLNISCDYRRPATAARINVEEPKLEMELTGPDEALWGSQVMYQLRVRNVGNGDAENIKLELMQTGSDMKSCELFLLSAGDEQVIPVDVWTGRQDHVNIDIQATGTNNVSAKVFKQVSVKRPNLEIRVESPTIQFVGNEVEYVVHAKNSGTAEAKNVNLTVNIPLGAKYVSSSLGGQATPQNQVVWNREALPVGAEFTATVTCLLNREGDCKLDVTATDKSGLVSNAFSLLRAEAMADLKMLVESPQGPIEVGQETIFTVTLTNRGTKPAEDVQVIASFAEGLEPIPFESANNKIEDGQVFFERISSIAGNGQFTTLKIKAKADKPGNHRIRVEVISTPSNTHLVYEQATFFYLKNRSSLVFSESNAGTVIGNTEPIVEPRPLGDLRQKKTAIVMPPEPLPPSVLK